MLPWSLQSQYIVFGVWSFEMGLNYVQNSRSFYVARHELELVTSAIATLLLGWHSHDRHTLSTAAYALCSALSCLD